MIKPSKITRSPVKRFAIRRVPAALAAVLLVLVMGGTWQSASAASAAAAAAPVTSPSAAAASPPKLSKSAHKDLTGKLNLNQATPEQLMLLPTVGPAKADRIVAWRKKNGGFKRVADLRRVKGFGYKTFKRLEPYLDVKGDTTLAVK